MIGNNELRQIILDISNTKKVDEYDVRIYSEDDLKLLILLLCKLGYKLKAKSEDNKLFICTLNFDINIILKHLREYSAIIKKHNGNIINRQLYSESKRKGYMQTYSIESLRGIELSNLL